MRNLEKEREVGPHRASQVVELLSDEVAGPINSSRRCIVNRVDRGISQVDCKRVDAGEKPAEYLEYFGDVIDRQPSMQGLSYHPIEDHDLAQYETI